MTTLLLKSRSSKDGELSVKLPHVAPEMDYEIKVSFRPYPDNKDAWPPGYFDLAGSIPDPEFQLPPKGEWPKPVELD